MPNSKMELYLMLVLVNGETVADRVEERLASALLKLSEEGRLNYLQEYLEKNKGTFIKHGKGVINVDEVCVGYFVVKE